MQPELIKLKKDSEEQDAIISQVKSKWEVPMENLFQWKFNKAVKERQANHQEN